MSCQVGDTASGQRGTETVPEHPLAVRGSWSLTSTPLVPQPEQQQPPARVPKGDTATSIRLGNSSATLCNRPQLPLTFM